MSVIDIKPMVKPRKNSVEYRNVRLKIDTYCRLEKWVLTYMQKKGERNVSFDGALNLMMDDLDSLAKQISRFEEKFKSERR